MRSNPRSGYLLLEVSIASGILAIVITTMTYIVLKSSNQQLAVINDISSDNFLKTINSDFRRQASSNPNNWHVEALVDPDSTAPSGTPPDSFNASFEFTTDANLPANVLVNVNRTSSMDVSIDGSSQGLLWFMDASVLTTSSDGTPTGEVATIASLKANRDFVPDTANENYSSITPTKLTVTFRILHFFSGLFLLPDTGSEWGSAEVLDVSYPVYGSSVRLSATPQNVAYDFFGWQVNGVLVSTENPYTLPSPITSDLTFDAIFQKK